jgi:hypothetical protein
LYRSAGLGGAVIGPRETADTKSVPPDAIDKLRKMFAFLDDMENPHVLAIDAAK